MDTTFVGEHLLPGKIGQFFIVLSLGSALLSLISYYFATVKETPTGSWKKLARISFWINVLAVIGIGSSLYYIIYNHLFEYHYAWKHSSRELPVYYIISCFWEGQEGGFWLWMFWQAVLGMVLLRKAKAWESPVMAVVMLSQVLLASTILGVEIFGERIGSSPFILLREAMQAPIFSRPDYLTMITDGNGLNPLLQNYWMVIHPPTLFLGFASMIVPFAYAIAGLWQRKYADWVKIALPWALFAVMVLGTGIIMGSFWAYEALNFGGFWAWDPVENASIIPWLTLIAGVHVMIAYKNSGHSYFTATFLVMISFIMVMYASFLTKSGVLGEASVHSFTDEGMTMHLVLLIVVFIVLAAWYLVKRYKELPITKKDEETYSREFWLFIGALVLTVSCVQVIATTSVPVFNAVFGTEIAPPTDVIKHYNKWQVPFAIVVTLISAFAQFLKYKKTDSTKFYISTGISFVISIIITTLFVYVTKVYTNIMYIVLTLSCIFAVIANGRILADSMKGKWKLAGSAVAHMGFALLLVGALVAAATSKVISVNNAGVNFGDEFAKSNNPRENILLYLNEPVTMDQYTVTYVGDTTEGPNTYYKVNYKRMKGDKVAEEFNLYPNAQQNVKMRQIVASPDTRHYLHKDIYTHVSSVPLKEEAEHEPHEGHTDEESYDKPSEHQVQVGDTVKFRDGYAVVKSVNRNATVQNIPVSGNDLAVSMDLEVVYEGKKFTAAPVYLLKNGVVYDFGKTIADAGLKFRFTNISPSSNSLGLIVYQKPKAERKWIVMKAIEFPYINLFWGGTIIMVIGFLLSIFRRNRELKLKA